MNKDQVVQLVKDGKLQPEEAVKRFEVPSQHIGEIPIDEIKVNVLDCGFPSLNDYMVFKEGRGELLVIGARPSMGKSAFLFQVATHIAKHRTVQLFSLEMDKYSIKARLLAAITGIGLQKFLRGEVSNDKLKEANAKLAKLNLYIDDESNLDIRTLVSRAEDFHKSNPTSLVVVDYLQLIKSGSRNTRDEEIGQITSQLKSLAKKLRCPVLVASQLSRKCVDRGNAALHHGREPDYKPELGDLRESGNIEQDADGVLFLSRHDYYQPGFRQGTADIGVSKQRNGPTGWVEFKWLGSSTRFHDQAQTQGDL